MKVVGVIAVSLPTAEPLALTRVFIVHPGRKIRFQPLVRARLRGAFALGDFDAAFDRTTTNATYQPAAKTT